MARTRPQQPVLATVTRTRDLTPTMRRITFTGPDLATFPALGDDQYVRVLFPRPGQAVPVLPEGASWYASLMKMDRDVRPVVRNYTLREVRPDHNEVDVDFVLHGDT